jgi:hypothetical protein
MIILKSTKFQHFSGNDRMVFKISSKIYLDIFHYKKIKWICKVAREVVGGPRGPIVIIVEVIQCKVD